MTNNNNSFKFSKTPVSTEVEKKLVIERLPSWMRETKQIQKFFDDAIQHWFTPEQQRTYDGYVGKHNGPGSAGKVFIDEFSAERNEYQLSPSYVSVDETNTVTASLTYPDLVSNLAFNGVITDNESRLFGGKYYSWAPPINPDMLINYSNYYWDTEADNNFKIPEYVCIERGSIDGNIWSYSNQWLPITTMNPDEPTVRLITKDLVESGRFIQAQRPIIEYVKDIELYDFGSYGRKPVDLVAENITPEDILFRSVSDNIRVDRRAITNGMRILFTNIANPGENNRVYKVITEIKDGKTVYGLTLDSEDQSIDRPTGEPLTGDTLIVLDGATYRQTQLKWDGSNWIKGQQRVGSNAPKFRLYDKEGYSLDDSYKYPNSSFSGSNLFSLKTDPTTALDSVYKLPVVKNEYGANYYVNNIATDNFTYTAAGETVDIPGMKFYKVIGTTEELDRLYSDWRLSSNKTYQNVVQTIVPETEIVDAERGRSEVVKTYELATKAVKDDITVDIGGELISDADYDFNVLTNEITINKAFKESDRIRVLVHNNNVPNKTKAAYEVPYNLKNNANNLAITELAESELASHLFDIIVNQEGFEGSEFGENNYSDTPKDLSVGRVLAQYDNSLLPLMSHASSNNLDIIKAATFSKTSYNSFYNKFKAQLDIADNEGFNESEASSIVTRIINRINTGKSDDFAFWLSRMGSSSSLVQTFIPATPQYLGILPTYRPEMLVVRDLGQGAKLYNRSHTGAYSVAYTNEHVSDPTLLVDQHDPRDYVIFELEMLIYNSINAKLRSRDYLAPLSVFDVRGGSFRTTRYTSKEWDMIALKGFEQWAMSNGIDYRTNHRYESGNWKTYNFSSCTNMISNEPVHGSWKRLYLDIFDTINPITHPWECLGFTQKPSWWDVAYTSYNPFEAEKATRVLGTGEIAYIGSKVWTDIENGFILEGERASIPVYNEDGTPKEENGYPVYTDMRFARHGIQNFTFFDTTTGELLAPWEGANPLINAEPTEANAKSDWRFGDIGDVEFAFMNSDYYPFESALTLYRAAPADWCNYFWSPVEYSTYTNGSDLVWLRDKVDTRFTISDDTLVHGENNTAVIGYSMWVSDHLRYNHLDITRNYGEHLRNSEVRLAYRLGGFSKRENLSFVSDSFGVVSQESQQITLLKSAPRRREVLSGVRVDYKDGEWIISGFDPSYPYFTYFKPVKSGKKISVRNNVNAFVQYQNYNYEPQIMEYDARFKSAQDVYDFIIGYGEYLGYQGWIFETQTDEGEFFDWRQMGAAFVEWVPAAQKVDRENRAAKIAAKNAGLAEPIVDTPYITLNPVSKIVKFATEHGHIESVTQFSGGSWTLIDEKGQGIASHEIDTARIGNVMTVSVNDDVNKKIMLIRLNIVEYEHQVIFDNTTIFGDIVYLPIFGLHQPRFRVYGHVTGDWTGRLEAPGFMIVGEDTLPNFEKLVQDFKRYYDSENPTTSVELSQIARHFIGFQTRDYLRRLILNDRNQLDFYKGFIKEKGTVQSFDKALRANKELSTPNFNVLEEWAFKIGEYGAINNQRRLEFKIDHSDIKQAPQLIVFDEAAEFDPSDQNSITYFGTKGRDSRWTTRSVSNQSFPTQSSKDVLLDLPDLGPININEVDIVASTIQDLIQQHNAMLKKGNMFNKAWVLDDGGSWNLRELVVTDVIAIDSSIEDGVSTITLNTSAPIEDGDLFFFVDSNKKYINSSVSSAKIYTDTNSADNVIIAHGAYNFDSYNVPLVLIKKVYTEAEKAEFTANRDVEVVNLKNFNMPVVYDQRFDRTEMHLSMWDPRQGVLPGIADSEVKYKSQYDPALYNDDDATSAAWGQEHVGEVWWDTSSAWYLDYNQPVLKPVQKEVLIEGDIPVIIDGVQYYELIAKFFVNGIEAGRVNMNSDYNFEANVLTYSASFSNLTLTYTHDEIFDDNGELLFNLEYQYKVENGKNSIKLDENGNPTISDNSLVDIITKSDGTPVSAVISGNSYQVYDYNVDVTYNSNGYPISINTGTQTLPVLSNDATVPNLVTLPVISGGVTSIKDRTVEMYHGSNIVTYTVRGLLPMTDDDGNILTNDGLVADVDSDGNVTYNGEVVPKTFENYYDYSSFTSVDFEDQVQYIPLFKPGVKPVLLYNNLNGVLFDEKGNRLYKDDNKRIIRIGHWDDSIGGKINVDTREYAIFDDLITPKLDRYGREIKRNIARYDILTAGQTSFLAHAGNSVSSIIYNEQTVPVYRAVPGALNSELININGKYVFFDYYNVRTSTTDMIVAPIHDGTKFVLDTSGNKVYIECLPTQVIEVPQEVTYTKPKFTDGTTKNFMVFDDDFNNQVLSATGKPVYLNDDFVDINSTRTGVDSDGLGIYEDSKVFDTPLAKKIVSVPGTKLPSLNQVAMPIYDSNGDIIPQLGFRATMYRVNGLLFDKDALPLIDFGLRREHFARLVVAGGISGIGVVNKFDGRELYIHVEDIGRLFNIPRGDGEPISGYVSKLISAGKIKNGPGVIDGPIFEFIDSPNHDSFGNPIFIMGSAANPWRLPIYNVALTPRGNTIYDADNNPIIYSRYVYARYNEQVPTETVTTPLYDNNGDVVTRYQVNITSVKYQENFTADNGDIINIGDIVYDRFGVPIVLDINERNVYEISDGTTLVNKDIFDTEPEYLELHLDSNGDMIRGNSESFPVFRDIYQEYTSDDFETQISFEEGGETLRQVGDFKYQTSTIRDVLTYQAYVIPYEYETIPVIGGGSRTVIQTVMEVDTDSTRAYRRENWGKLLPGGDIVLYEWVRSPVKPSEWGEYVKQQSSLNKSKQVWHPTGEALTDNWAAFTEYDIETNTPKTFYYFWVKNATSVPNVSYRNRSVSDLQSIIKNPTKANINWFAPVDKNSFIVSGFENLVSNSDSVLQIKYKEDANNEMNVHKQWQIAQRGIDYRFDTEIWDQMYNSLVGQTPSIIVDGVEEYETILYPTSDLGLGDKKTWFKDITEARREFVSAANQYLLSVNMTSNLDLMENVFNYEQGNINPFERTFEVVYDGELKTNVILIFEAERFKDNDAVILSTNGILPNGLDKTSTYFIERTEHNNNFFRLKATPTTSNYIQIVSSSNDPNAIDDSKGVGVHTIIRSEDYAASIDTSIDMKDFWSTIDWYADGVTADTPYVIEESLAGVNNLDYDLDDVIRIVDEDGRWTMYKLTMSRDVPVWSTVGRKNSTIQLNDRLYNYSTEMFTDEGTPSAEEQRVRKVLRNIERVFLDVQSRIVFAMVDYALVEQYVLDWAFKTSYIQVVGIDKALASQSLTKIDPIEDVMEYIMEVKPYRTKLRNSMELRSNDDDTVGGTMNDLSSDPTMMDKLRAEYDKPHAERDFSQIKADFREKTIRVFYDNKQDYADEELKTFEEYNTKLFEYDTLENAGKLPLMDYTTRPELVQDMEDFLSVANRMKLSNPEMSSKDIFDAVGAGFKGRVVSNSPATRSGLGYAGDVSPDVSYQSSTLAKQLHIEKSKELIDQNIRELLADSGLSEDTINTIINSILNELDEDDNEGYFKA